MTKLFKFIKKYRILLSIILIIIIIVLVFLTMLGHEIDKSISRLNVITQGHKIFHYDQIKYTCTKGDIQTTISEDKSLKVTIECLGNLDKIYDRVYPLPNNNILFVNFFNSKQKFNNENYDYQTITKKINDGKLPIEAKVFNTKINKLEPVDLKMLKETEFIYGISKSLPENKLLINNKVLFNYENNRFYLILWKNMKAYFAFIDEPKKEYKYIKLYYKFKDSTELYIAQKFTGERFDYGVWWLEDNISLRRSKAMKFRAIYFLSEKYKNELFFIDDDSNVCSFNLITGKKSILSANNNAFLNNETTFIYPNKLIIADRNIIDIIDLKTKKVENYKIAIKSSHKNNTINNNPLKNEPYVIFSPNGYIIYYNFYSKQAYLFNLKTKKQYVIDNLLNLPRIKTDFLYSNSFNCYKNSIYTSYKQVESSYNLHSMPISPSEMIIAGGSVSCTNENKILDVKIDKNEVIYKGYNLYDLSIKKIKVRRMGIPAHHQPATQLNNFNP